LTVAFTRPSCCISTSIELHQSLLEFTLLNHDSLSQYVVKPFMERPKSSDKAFKSDLDIGIFVMLRDSIYF